MYLDFNVKNTGATEHVMTPCIYVLSADRRVNYDHQHQ